jgi:putative flippase GtrA
LIERAALPLLWANALAFSVAVFVSYFGNHAWTFGRTGYHRKHFPRFLAVALGGLLLNQSIVFLTVEIAGIPYLYGILLVVLIVPGLSFSSASAGPSSASTCCGRRSDGCRMNRASASAPP